MYSLKQKVLPQLGAGLIFFNLFISCTHDIIQPSVSENANQNNSSVSAFLPPENLVVTNGAKGKIQLSWSPVEKAKKYRVYAAVSPFDEMKCIQEVVTPSAELKCEAGVTRFFKVTSIDYKGNESVFSSMESGSTLARPVITEIRNGTDEENKVTVYWYMLNEDSYRSAVMYDIKCSKESLNASGLSGKDLEELCYTFEDVPKGELLSFQVLAYLSDTPNEVEESPFMDKMTLASQIPSAAEEVSASYGLYPDKIVLQFKLPEPVHVKTGIIEGVENYEIKPLFFKVLRREKLGGEWATIVEHLYFDGVEKLSDDEEKSFEDYEAGKTVIYEDKKRILPHMEYEYKIQSFIDDYRDAKGENILQTGTKSITEVFTGSSMAFPGFRTSKRNYIFSEDKTKKLEACYGFEVSWDNYGIENDFSFVVKEIRDNFENQGSPVEKFYVYSTIQELNQADSIHIPLAAKSDDGNYQDDKSNEGNYTYELYIVPKETTPETAGSMLETAYVSVKSQGVIRITTDLTEPTLESFSVEDGYKDKVILKWLSEGNDLSYSVRRQEIDLSGKNIGEDQLVFDKLYAAPNSVFEKEDKTVESGKLYKYVLYATSDTKEIPSDAKTAKTLGIPAPIFNADSTKRSSVTVTWEPVLLAEKYQVIFGDNEFNYIEGASENSEEIKCQGNGNFIFTLNNPEGFNKAKESGLDMNLVLKTYSDKDSSEAKIDVRTLGPAKAEINASKAIKENTIEVSWNVITGAKGYVLRRAICDLDEKKNDISLEENTGADPVYYYIVPHPANIDGDVSEESDAEFKTVPYVAAKEVDGKIIFIDKYKACSSGEKVPADGEVISRSMNQEMISWGFPYRYTVIPLEEALEEIEIESLFTDFKEVSAIGSCKGYGMKVSASKSEDPRNISITWKKPYGQSAKTQPVLWKSISGENDWSIADEAICEMNDSNDFIGFTYSPKGAARTKAFEFAVSYRDSSAIHEKFTNYLAGYKDENNAESLNKGYAFAVDLKFTPVYRNHTLGMEERFVWNLWDYNERAVGPEPDSTYLFQMKNNDYAIVDDSNDGWYTVAEISQAGVLNTLPYADSYVKEKYNINVESAENGMMIAPKELLADNHGWYEGLLKIQRDYRHYARLIISRQADSGEIQASYSDKGASLSSGESLIYGYRNFTDGEIARMALMLISYGFYLNDGGNANLDKMGQFKYDGKHTFAAAVSTGNEVGSASFTDRSRSDGGKFKQYFTFTLYNSSMKTPGGMYSVTPISISTETQYSAGIKGDVDNYIYCFRDKDMNFKVQANNSDYENGELESTVTVTCTGNNNLSASVKRDATGASTSVVETNDNSIRKWWFPMQIHSDKSYLFTDFNYGWWPKGN